MIFFIGSILNKLWTSVLMHANYIAYLMLLMTLQMSHTHQPKPLVYMWGGGVSIPMVLSQPPESRITGVAVGRSHRAGITEDGKLIFWEVS